MGAEGVQWAPLTRKKKERWFKAILILEKRSSRVSHGRREEQTKKREVRRDRAR